MSTTPSTVLVADDDDVIREAIVEFFREDTPWNVLEARDGAEALELTLSQNPNAVVLDQRMPRMVGADVVRKLRGQGVTTPIVLITAAADAAELATELGLRCYLGKPFSLEQLSRLVQRALDGEC